MSLLWQDNQIIGLDISDLSLKMVQLEKDGDKIKINAAGKIDLPPDTIKKGEIINREELIKKIRQLLTHPKFGKITTDEVVACLPEEKTFLKIVEVDKNTTDFPLAVLKESEKHIPLAKEDIYYDWQIVKESIRTKAVLIAAAPKKLTDEYVNILKEAKLITTVLENEPLSICRSLLKEEGQKNKKSSQKNYAILDIGATNASMTVYAKDTIIFSVSMPISGEKITEKIAEKLNIEKNSAEKEKILYSLPKTTPKKEIEEILKEMINDLIFKSREALNFYDDHFSSWGPISQIILCGGGANTKDIEKIISKELGIETIKGNVLTNLGEKNIKNLNTFKESIETGNSESEPEAIITYAAAIGLALRGIFN